MGLDRIHNRMLKNLNTENRKSLLTTINLMFREGYIPKDWKCVIVTPILKRGKPPEEGESYRPISLTSCLGKAMEKMINNRLKWHLDHLTTKCPNRIAKKMNHHLQYNPNRISSQIRLQQHPPNHSNLPGHLEGVRQFMDRRTHIQTNKSKR
jgi:hypothetical protein